MQQTNETKIELALVANDELATIEGGSAITIGNFPFGPTTGGSLPTSTGPTVPTAPVFPLGSTR